MSDAILVLNAGSSSLKFSLFRRDESLTPLFRGQVEGLFASPRFVVRDAANQVVAERTWADGGLQGHAAAVDYLFTWGREAIGADRIVAAGHRVAHGGRQYRTPVLVDEEVLQRLDEFTPLAPLHQPHSLAAIRAVSTLVPGLAQVACFDTSFHRHLPAVAQACGLPRRFAEEGIVRYGFHGLSYEFIASVLPSVDPRAARGRTVVAHLGNGTSMCAMQESRSIATTMGFTAVDGLLMGTRSGRLDPGILIYLMDAYGYDARSLERLLYQESGLLGVSGISSDMRTLLGSSDPRAAEAIDLFVYRIGLELGGLASTLGGLDALVFTGGIGEHAAPIRQRVCQDAAWLGLEFDPVANARHDPRISRGDSEVTAWVIPTNEERMIAEHTVRLLTG